MLQETSLTLALLYTEKFEGNIYYNNNNIRELALSQVKYWAKIQNKNGSFDEFYPNEQSFSATAFTLYSSCLTIIILNNDLIDIKSYARKACKFLVNYGNPGASNQVAAAIAAINIYSELYSDNTFDNKVKEMLDSLLLTQSSEGWMPEYGGFDVGYQSITISYLSDYCKRKPNEFLSDRLLNMIEFLAHFIHPDGSVGGEYGSRNTSFLAPFGFAFNCDRSTMASAIIHKLFINNNSNLNHFLDDRYICHFILPSYLLSIHWLKDKKIEDSELPNEKLFIKKFKESGLWVESRKDFYFICNTNKQSVFKVYSKTGKGVISNLGYIITKGNQLAVTNWINNNADTYIKNSNLKTKGSFFIVSNKIPNSLYHFILRIVSFILKKRLLPILKKYFIIRDESIKVFFERSIEVSDTYITINDIIHSELKNRFNLDVNETSSFRYVAPSNYFQTNELTFSNSSIINNSKLNDVKISQKIDCVNFKITKSF